jgi:plasmid maintenance system antidote protein VapI
MVGISALKSKAKMPAVGRLVRRTFLPELLGNDPRMAKKPSHALEILAANLQRMMAASAEYDTQPKLARQAKMDQKTISRIVNKQNEPSIDKLEKLAKVFHLEPWQMLVPGLAANRKPQLVEQEEFTS